MALLGIAAAICICCDSQSSTMLICGVLCIYESFGSDMDDNGMRQLFEVGHRLWPWRVYTCMRSTFTASALKFLQVPVSHCKSVREYLNHDIVWCTHGITWSRSSPIAWLQSPRSTHAACYRPFSTNSSRLADMCMHGTGIYNMPVIYIAYQYWHAKAFTADTKAFSIPQLYARSFCACACQAQPA